MLVRRWVFEVNAPADDFSRALKAVLAKRGLALGPAKVFDFSVRGYGARGYVKIVNHERGLEAQVKVKGLFGDVPALEAAILESGRAAQAGLVFHR